MAKYLIDMVQYWNYRGGITHVWDCILAEWVKSGFSDRVILIDRGDLPEIAQQYRRVALPFFHENYEAEHQALELLCRQMGATGFMSTGETRPTQIPMVHLVHDFIVEDLTYPGFPPDIWRKHETINYAKRLIAVSASTAKRIPAFVKDAPKPIRVIHNASDLVPEHGHELSRIVDRPYFLHVGGVHGYKNGQMVLDAIGQIPKVEFDLVMTGDATNLAMPANRDQFEIHTGHTSRVQLTRLYQQALALVHVSEREGFGLPIVEALSCGCPIICLDTDVNREIAGDTAIYIDNRKDSARLLANAMSWLLKDPVLQDGSRGLIRSQEFSWAASARAYAEELSSL